MIPEFSLNNGMRIPAVGLGTWRAKDGEQAYRAVLDAVEAGYRSFDTAKFYFNEESIGRAIRDAGVPREQLHVTTKLWNDAHGYEKTLAAFEESRQRLGLEYIDEYLIHWPGMEDTYLPTWKAMEKLYREGAVRVIGVCNFTKPTLANLLAHCEVRPMINQIEANFVFQPDVNMAYCAEQGVLVEAWRPLVHGRLENETISAIAAAHGKSPAQAALRWLYQRGVRTLPKSVNPERMRENLAIFDFSLTDEEVAAINKLNTWVRTGESPDEFFMLGRKTI